MKSGDVRTVAVPVAEIEGWTVELARIRDLALRLERELADTRGALAAARQIAREEAERHAATIRAARLNVAAVAVGTVVVNRSMEPERRYRLRFDVEEDGR